MLDALNRKMGWRSASVRILVEHAACIIHEAGLAREFWILAFKHMSGKRLQSSGRRSLSVQSLCRGQANVIRVVRFPISARREIRRELMSDRNPVMETL